MVKKWCEMDEHEKKVKIPNIGSHELRDCTAEILRRRYVVSNSTKKKRILIKVALFSSPHLSILPDRRASY